MLGTLYVLAMVAGGMIGLPVALFTNVSLGVVVLVMIIGITIGFGVARTLAGLDFQESTLEDQRREQSSKDTSTPVSKVTVRDAVAEPTPEMLHAALFDLLCCIMVADGRASTKERSAIREIMSKLKSGWSDDECDRRISSFIGDIQNQGYPTVLRRSMSKLEIFKQIGREGVLLKCIDLVANTDGKLSQRERDLCDRIRNSMGVAAPSNTD